ncbi:MAG: uroporphyrinogen-III synthase, partial [Methyloceanibacter sp.]
RNLAPHGFDVRQAVLYRAVPVVALPPATLTMLQDGKIDGVILMSPRTAKIFAALLIRDGAATPKTAPICYCLSEAIAGEVAPLGFTVRVAAIPREEDVLALLDGEAASSA